MTDLIEFLTQRIAEDEAIALKAGGDSPRYAEWGYVGEYDRDTSGEVYLPLTKHVETFGGSGRTYTSYEYVTSDCEGLRPAVEGHAGPHIARHDPARVLRECAAKRAILAQHPIPEPQTDDELHRQLAHPDYEYEVFEYGRKTGADRYEPTGDGWEMFHEERFDYTEEERWRRLRPNGPRPPYLPVVLVTLASAYSDHPDFDQRWAL